jgi:hypothetical protein
MVFSPLFTYKLPAVDVIITKLGHQCHSHPCRELVDAILDFRKRPSDKVSEKIAKKHGEFIV